MLTIQYNEKKRDMQVKENGKLIGGFIGPVAETFIKSVKNESDRSKK